MSVEAKDPAKAAASRMASHAGVTVGAPGEPAADMPVTVFNRLGVERRALGAISDELHNERLGARNSLAALTDHLRSDPGTTRPPPPNERLEIEGLSAERQERAVLEVLERLVQAGLVERRGGLSDPAHTYHLTGAGIHELSI